MSEPVKAIGDWANNAQLIADVAKLGYLDGRVLDLTYGLGRFWSVFRPEYLVTNDLDESRDADFHFDFTNTYQCLQLGVAFDTVVCDPPYKACLDLETTALTRRGWLSYNEIRAGDFVWSLNHTTGLAGWELVESVNVYEAEPTEVYVADGLNLKTVATVNHKWPVMSSNGVRSWKESSTLATGDKVIHAASWAGRPTEATLPDSLVELLAWWWTEGSSPRRGSFYTAITQSHTINPGYCARIEHCLLDLFGPPVDKFSRLGRHADIPKAWRITKSSESCTRYVLSASIGRILSKWAPDRVPTLEFYETLTQTQLELFIEISMLADGQNNHVIAQARKDQAESFALCLITAGQAVSLGEDGNGYRIRLRKRLYSKPFRNGWRRETLNVGVWCPTVPTTNSWFARKEGRCFFTGNSGRPSGLKVDTDYGVDRYRTLTEVDRLRYAGVRTAEVLTKPGGFLLLKCQDQIVSGKPSWQTYDTVEFCHNKTRFELLEDFKFVSYRPQPAGRRQVHARRNYSSLLIFKKGK